MAPQYEWTKSIDQTQDNLKDEHRQLKQLSKGKKMFYLRPNDQDMFKRVITSSKEKNLVFSARNSVAAAAPNNQF